MSLYITYCLLFLLQIFFIVNFMVILAVCMQAFLGMAPLLVEFRNTAAKPIVSIVFITIHLNFTIVFILLNMLQEVFFPQNRIFCCLSTNVDGEPSKSTYLKCY